MPLNKLIIDTKRAKGLEVLRGMALQELTISNLQFKNLQFLDGMPLKEVGINYNKILEDISRLKNMQIKKIHLQTKKIPTCIRKTN